MMRFWQRIRLRLLRLFGGEWVHYINGAQTLPAPLSAQEEAAALEGLERGERAAQNALITHNLRLVVYIARKFENSGVGIEDLISIGTIGLIKAVDSFKIDNGARFATYAAKCIQNAILS